MYKKFSHLSHGVERPSRASYTPVVHRSDITHRRLESHVQQKKRGRTCAPTPPSDASSTRLVVIHPLGRCRLLGHASSHVSRHQGRHSAEAQHPPDAIVAGHPARLLRQLEDGAAEQGGDDLRGRDGDVVEAEDDACLVLDLVAFRGTLEILGEFARRGAVARPSRRFAFADFGADERERGPQGQCPGNANHADEDGPDQGRSDKERAEHTDSVKNVR